MSGLQILNAHPALYWGQFGADDDHAFIQFYATRSDGELTGHTRIGSWKLTTTGLFGASAGNNGELTVRAMPTWAMLPSFRSKQLFGYQMNQSIFKSDSPGVGGPRPCHPRRTGL